MYAMCRRENGVKGYLQMMRRHKNESLQQNVKDCGNGDGE